MLYILRFCILHIQLVVYKCSIQYYVEVIPENTFCARYVIKVFCLISIMQSGKNKILKLKSRSLKANVITKAPTDAIKSELQVNGFQHRASSRRLAIKVRESVHMPASDDSIIIAIV